jgi:RNA polymerase sigma factor (sigma-70 family)
MACRQQNSRPHTSPGSWPPEVRALKATDAIAQRQWARTLAEKGVHVTSPRGHEKAEAPESSDQRNYRHRSSAPRVDMSTDRLRRGWVASTGFWRPLLLVAVPPTTTCSTERAHSSTAEGPTVDLLLGLGSPADLPQLHETPAKSGSWLRSASVATLVIKAREGDATAWEELVARFGGMIAATGRRYRLGAPDVAELQQTTWLRLVENLHRIEQPERVGGWLATTARRESLQLLKRASKYRSGADQMLANMPDRHLPEPDAGPIAEEGEVVLRAAWGRLKPRCQELLTLLMTDDPLGYKDLSALLEIPVGSIGPTRQRCLEHLKRLVEEEGLTDI